MARPVDEKIVAMKMDNSDFKRKAIETTGLFGKLQSALAKVPGVNSLSRVTESLSGINSAAQRVDLSSIANNVDNISQRFSTLGVVATTALANIANKAVNAGTQLAKSLTVDPLMDGFREYENKMGSIGTMLSNTEWNGSTLKDVKKTLGELNDYADNTIYSFEQMTANIGRFTAAGVTLEDSAIAIKGLGNLAAISGSNTDQLNTAMYQMSQALASGKLNLMDWNSLVNAGMAGKKTQDALVATAKAMGKNVDLSDGFRNSISEGWLTSEVFLATLKKFGKDKSMTKAATSVRTFTGMIAALKEGVGSGWAETWELVFGDFNQATERWTALSEVIGGFFKLQSDARNRLVGKISEAGIFEGIFMTITNTGLAVLKIVTAIGKGIGRAFGGGNSGLLKAIGKGLNSFADALVPGKRTLEIISTIFYALATPIALVVKGLLLLGKVFVAVLKIPLKLIGLVLEGIFKMVGFVADLTASFIDTVSSSKMMESAMKGVSNVFKGMNRWIDNVSDGLSVFRSAVSEAWSILTKGDFTGKGPWEEDSKIVDKLFRIREGALVFASGVVEAWNILAKGDFTGKGPWEEDSEIVDRLFKIREGVQEFVSGVVEAWNILAKGDFTGVGPWEEDSKIVDRLFRIREAVIEFGETISETWTVLMSGKTSDAGPWSEDSPIVKGLVKMREGFLNLGDAVSSLDLSSALGGVLGVFSSIGSAIKNLEFSKVLLPIANGFEYITEKISDMSFSLEPVGKFFGMLVSDIKAGFEWIIDGAKSIGNAIKEMLPSGNQLFAGGFIAGLIAMMGLAIKIATDMYAVFTGWGQIGDGVTEVLDGVGNALNAFSAQVYANALLTIAIAVGILAVSFWALSKLDGQQIANGLYAIIGSMTALVGALAIMTKYDITGTGMKAAVQIVALAIAFSILAGALRKVSDLKWSEITKGLYGLGGTMAIFAGAMVIMSKFGGGKISASALQMLALAGTVYLLVLVLKRISDMDTGKIAKGMTGLAVALAIFAGAVTLMSRFGSGKIAASALQFVAIAGSILIMVEAIRQIAEIKPDNLKTGLTVIGLILGAIAAFTVITSDKGLLSAGVGISLLAVALNLMVVPILALGSMSLPTLAKGLGAMAIALVAIGAASMLMTGMVAAGAGLILLAIGMNLLLVPISAFAAMPLSALAIGIGALAVGILAIGGAGIALGMAGPALLIGAAGVAALGIAMLAAGAGVALFATGLVTLATMTGTAVTTIVAFLVTLIAGLVSLIPSAVDFIAKIVMHMANKAVEMAPILAGKFMDMITRVLNAIALRIPEFATAATNLITRFLDAITENLPRIVESGANLMIAFIESLAVTVQTEGPRFTAAIQTLMAEVLLIMVNTGIAVIQALFGWIPGVTDATNQIGETAEKTIRDAFGAAEVGKTKGGDFASSLSGTSSAASRAGLNIANAGKTGADGVNLSPIGSGHGSDFASALSGKASAASTAGLNIANAGKNGADGVELKGVGMNFGQGFANGINSQSVLTSVISAGKSLAKKARDSIADWLGIASPSRVMRTDGGWFGTGFALGIADKARMVGEKAKGLAMTAKDSLNQFLNGFEIPQDDNELHFKAVVDYESLDSRKFGTVGTLSVAPDTSVTSSLVTASKVGIISGVQARNGLTVDAGQNDNNSAVIKQQEEQIGLLKKQNELLNDISNKDNSLYLDSKEVYNTTRNHQNNQTIVRNIFKGVNAT
jgi:tape measure domain-containing protein